MNVYYIVILCLMCSHHDSMKLFEITLVFSLKEYRALYILSRVTRKDLNELLTLQNLVYFLCANL
jgi:hypothetical protein